MSATANIEAALVFSLNARRGVPVGRTWGDFQAAMTQLGVKDTDELSSIEVGIARTGTGLLIREDDDHGRVEVREKF